MTPIYLDNAATTADDPRVAERMFPFLRVDLGREGGGADPPARLDQNDPSSLMPCPPVRAPCGSGGAPAETGPASRTYLAPSAFPSRAVAPRPILGRTMPACSR